MKIQRINTIFSMQNQKQKKENTQKEKEKEGSKKREQNPSFKDILDIKMRKYEE